MSTTPASQHEDEEYCHWSFPDDESRDSEGIPRKVLTKFVVEEKFRCFLAEFAAVDSRKSADEIFEL
jgi:hypothetical protein